MTILSKELEKLKYELGDVIDNKFEFITKNLELETKKLRETYEELSADLSNVNQSLIVNFKENSIKLKAMCASYFAKCEMKVDTDIAKVDTIEGEW